MEVPIERMSEDDAERGLHWRTRIEMIADADGRPSMHRRGTHVRVPIDTMPLASRTLLEVAEREHVWEGSFEPGSQIRLSVPEPRDNAPISDNYAVLVNGEVVAGSRELTEKVIVAGREFEYNVDAGGFWQMHRHAPIALTNHVIDLVRGELDGAKSRMSVGFVFRFGSVHAAVGHADGGAHSHVERRRRQNCGKERAT